ncbi:MAG: membrane protein insertase YidC [Thiotrichales bacterium]
MENQRTFLYLSLLFVGFLLWQAWSSDQAQRNLPPIQSTPSSAPSATALVDPVDVPVDTPTPSTAPDASAVPQPHETTGTSSASIVSVVTDVFQIGISTRGGDIVELKLPTYPVSLAQPDKPLVLYRTQPFRYLLQSGLIAEAADSSAERAPSHHSEFEPLAPRYELAPSESELRVPLRWRSADGLEVDKIYTFRRGSFLIDISYEIRNNSNAAWQGRHYRQLRHGPVDTSGDNKLLYTYTGAAYYTDKYEKLPFDDLAKKPVSFDLTGGWAAMTQHYFLSALLPSSQNEINQLYTKVARTGSVDEYMIGLLSPNISIAPGEQTRILAQVYAGPKLQKDLEALAPGLDLTADYGIFAFIAKPLFWLLNWLHSWLHNWGWAIIALTFLIKLVFYKPSEMSYRSMAKMRAVAPKLQQIKERYGDDKQRQQQALMELYKKEKINPLGGCLPILIQIPVFIALYWVLLETVELRQAPWMLWIKDLSLRDPYFILPVLMGITMFIQQKLNPAPPDPIQAKIMMALPFVFTVFFAFFPAGLVLYWFVNNLLSIAQQGWITSQIEKSTTKA